MVEQHLLDSARRLSDRLVQLQSPIRVLDAINWDRSIREEFFKHKGERLPQVDKAMNQELRLRTF